jgi:type IV pilus assembly protein PilY1
MTTYGLLKKTGRALLFSAVAANAPGATTDLSNVPLVTSSSSTVRPNLLFILDDSGSMAWTHMPDDNSDGGSSVTFDYGYYGLRSSQCNGVYYNPAIAYEPPVHADGTSYPNAVFTAAWKDGYDTAAGTVNLSTGFKAEGDSSGTAAYYFTYSGTQTTAAQKDYNSTANTFYKECNSASGASPGKDVFTKVTVSAASGPGGTDERQNFANWYSYYRTRMLMMKTASGRAFKAIDDHYRVGFMSINSNSTFLNLETFDSTQKSAWYAKLYGSAPSGSTPLRKALANAGRLYAGKLTLSGVTVKDPVQYSCQQNFTILSSDGFWNSGAGFKVNGSTAVGNQDGTEIRPYFDGASVIVTETTPTTTVVKQQTVTQKTTTTVWSRYSYSLGAKGADGCSSSRRKVHRQKQTYTQTKVSTTTSVDEVTTTTNHVVVKTNGVLTSDTTVPAPGSPSTTNISSDTSTDSDTGVPDGSTAWINSGSETATGSCSSNPSLPSPNPSDATAGTPSTSVTSGPTVTVLSTDGPTVGATTTTTVNSGGTSDTLADVAEYYYVTDLRDSSLSNCAGALGSGTDVCDNEVPSNGQDSASWQHMTTFTLGLGARGRMIFSPSYLSDTSGDYFAVKNGSLANPPSVCPWQASGSGMCNWPIPGMASSSDGKIENIDDLWHAAVNGRGTYFSATDPASLATGLASALAGVSARNGASAAATTSNPNVTSGDNFVFSSTFTTVDWVGELVRQQIDLTDGSVPAYKATDHSTYDWAAQAKLDARNHATRIIHTYDPLAANRLKPFTAGNFGGSAYFNSPHISTLSQFCASGPACLGAAAQADAAGDKLVDFLRGDRGNEGALADAGKYYRQRTHVLGDIVNAEAVYVKGSLFDYVDSGYSDFAEANASRQSMVYAAANDGMLHAFNADTGEESWAYIPSPVLPNLYKLADKNYANLHQYFVDGTPHTGDVYFGGAWHTLLVGGLNLGGRGYYALDITDPAAPKALWEFTVNNDADLGYTYGNPVITKLKNGVWVVLLTSGYNNVSPGGGGGHLYVLNAETGALIRKISTGAGSTATPSGLARINAWVDNTAVDNTALRVYGGDLLGNLWRFDINGDVGADGYDAQLLATLQDGNGNAQPITAKPELGEVSGKAVVYVGTGRFLGTTDLSDKSQQSFYAVKDNLGSASYGDPRAPGNNFIQQILTDTLCPENSPSTICSTGQIVRTATNTAVNFANDNGWYLDFVPANSGERANTDPTLALGTLVFTTNVPDEGACTMGGYSFRYFLDYRTGSFVSSSKTGVVGEKLDNALATRAVVVGLPNNTVIDLIRTSIGDTLTENHPINSPSGPTRRVSWRELTTGR